MGGGVWAVVTICIVGLCGCVGYLLYLAFVTLRRRFGREKEEFELDEDVLEVDLRQYRKQKRK